MLALGGQGGGVLTKWLVDLAENSGFLAQSTYVAGVAQRTGATVYCVEMFPCAVAKERGEPVFTPYPVPGDVDLVIAGELAETGRAILKGFVTPNATTLIASTHRVYSIEEKSALGDGIIDQSPVLETAEQVSKKLVAFDMESVANETGSIVSAVMFGAIAASSALPFSREDFEAAIERAGKAVASNLRGFQAGFDDALTRSSSNLSAELLAMPKADGPAGIALLDRAKSFPAGLAEIVSHGALRALEYQDSRYADEYLDAVQDVYAHDDASKKFRLSKSYARNLALQMCYEDTIRVAELKTRDTRFERIRSQLGVSVESPAYIVEYFHPRFEEFCDTLPAGLGRRLMNGGSMRRVLTRLMNKGRNVTTNKIGGFVLLSTLARLKRWRRSTLRFQTQHRMLAAWNEQVLAAATDDYDYSVAIVDCIEIVRGYGETWERGMTRFSRSMAAMTRVDRSPAVVLRALHQAALVDEGGERFDAVINEYEAV